MESDASGKDQVAVWSEGSNSKPVNVEVDCGESEDEDEELYLPSVRPGTSPCGCSQREGHATAIVDSSG